MSYLAVEFRAGQVDDEGFVRLRELVEQGLVLVIDLEFVRRSPDGSLETVPAGSLGQGVDLSAFAGVDAGLLDAEDLARVTAGLADDSVLAVLVYEELAMQSVLAAWGAGGAVLVAEGPVDVADLEAALDADRPG